VGKIVGEWLRPFLIYLVCFAILISASYLAFAFVKPRWNAPGFPKYIGYGKNVEQAAFILTLLGVAAYVIGFSRPRLSFASLAWFVVVLAVLKIHYDSWQGKVILLALVAAIGIYCTWYERLRDRPGAIDRVEMPRRRWVAPTFLVAMSAYCFVAALHPVAEIDLLHQGEPITSALDLLNGGIPFRTFYWPHGLSDTGVAALVIRLTGNTGLGAVILTHAIVTPMMLWALFILARGLINQTGIACLATGLITVLTFNQLSGGVFRAHWIAGSLIPFLAFAALSGSTTRRAQLGVGALLGLGYLWRIETGVFAVATTILFLFVSRYHATFGVRAAGVREMLTDWRTLLAFGGDAGCLLAGVAASLASMRLITGFPTSAWFHETLINLPRYHTDSTGMPLPLAVRGLAPWSWSPDPSVRLVGLPLTFLLALGLFAFTLRKGVERRLPFAGRRDRFFFLVLAYSLLNLKSAMDRSDAPHLLQATHILVLVVLLDGLEFLRQRLRPTAAVMATGIACLAVATFFWTCFSATDKTKFFSPQVRQFALLQSCLRPTSIPAEMMAPTTDPNVGDLLEAVAATRALLDQHGVGRRQLLITHTAPLLYPLLGVESPTRFFSLSTAASPAMERKLVGDLERNQVRAVLRVSGICRSIMEMDIPDRYRVPLVHRYLSDRFGIGRTYQTKLGTLTILSEATAPLPAATVGAVVPGPNSVRVSEPARSAGDGRGVLLERSMVRKGTDSHDTIAR
jgi:hypothetical protein